MIEPDSVELMEEQEHLLDSVISLLDGELKAGDPHYIAELYRIIFTYLKYKKTSSRHIGVLNLIDRGVTEKLLELALGNFHFIFFRLFQFSNKFKKLQIKF